MRHYSGDEKKVAVGLYGGAEMASQKVVDGKLSRKTVPEKLVAHR